MNWNEFWTWLAQIAIMLVVGMIVFGIMIALFIAIKEVIEERSDLPEGKERDVRPYRPDE